MSLTDGRSFRTRRSRFVALGLAALIGAVVPQAGAASPGNTVIEERLARENLCAGLRTEQFGQTIALTHVDSVELREADISLRGDAVTATFSGRLACRSAQESLLTGDASAAVVAEARLSLSDCTIGALSIGLSDFGGTFGPALGAFAPQIEDALASEARPLLVAACRDFLGSAR